MDNNPDYSAYLIEARVMLDTIADLARRRQFMDAAIKTTALARLLGGLAQVLTRDALARKPP